MKHIGNHLIADIDGLDPLILQTARALADRLELALTLEGYGIIKRVDHDFHGGGFTTMFLLSESHASLHSYPEHGYLAFDLFSCGDKRPENVLQMLLKDFPNCSVQKRLTPRQSTIDSRSEADTPAD